VLLSGADAGAAVPSEAGARIGVVRGVLQITRQLPGLVHASR